MPLGRPACEEETVPFRTPGAGRRQPRGRGGERNQAGLPQRRGGRGRGPGGDRGFPSENRTATRRLRSWAFLPETQARGRGVRKNFRAVRVWAFQ